MRASLFKAAGLYATASVVNGALPFLLLPILTRYMPPADYALTVLFTTFATFAAAFTSINLHGAINVRYFDRVGHPIDRYISTCCTIILIATGITAVIVLAASDMISRQVGVPAPWLLAAVVFSACQGIVQIRLVCWQAASRPMPYVTFQLALALLTAVSTIGLVVFLGRGWQGRLESQLGVMIAFAVVALVLMSRGKLLRASFDRQDARDALSYGLPLIPHSVGALLIAMSDRVLVASKLGLNEAGVYSAGMQLGLVTALLADAFNRAYNPWLYSRLAENSESVRAEVVRFTYRYFIVALLAGTIIGVAAPIMAALLVDKSYGAASQFSFWISVGGSFQGMYYMAGLLIAYARKTHWLAIVTIVGGLLNVPMTSWLIDQSGALGASQAYAIIQALFFLSTWLLSMKLFPMPWFRR